MITDRFPRLRGLVLDMDGVLWRDEEAIGNLPQTFDTIRELGLSFVLATNNSSKSVDEYLAKLAGFGVFLEPKHILSSAMATLAYLKDEALEGAKVFVIGSDSLKKRFMDHGYEILSLDESQVANAVVVGLDKNLNYETLRYASQLIRNGARFIATNADATFPIPGGLIPGAGTIVKAVEVASGQTPIMIGKPERFMFEQALNRMGIQPDEAMAVGDRLETDILGAQNAGLLNALVLSGVTTLEEAKASSIRMDMISNNLWELLND